jgi:hypothetical protein
MSLFLEFLETCQLAPTGLLSRKTQLLVLKQHLRVQVMLQATCHMQACIGKLAPNLSAEQQQGQASIV